MYLGCKVYVKHEGTLKIGNVITIHFDELEILLEDGTKINKKYWEIGKVKNEEN